MAGTQPGYPATPAITDDADTRSIDRVECGQQIIGGLNIEDRSVVAKLFALDIHLCFLGPPVEDERHGNGKTVRSEPLNRLQGEGVIFHACVTNRNMLGQDQAGVGAGVLVMAIWLEYKNFHFRAGAVPNDDSLNTVHAFFSLLLVVYIQALNIFRGYQSTQTTNGFEFFHFLVRDYNNILHPFSAQ